jgi:hypothetical protein
MQWHDLIQANPFHDSKPDGIVFAIGIDDITTARPANEGEILVDLFFVWFTFHPCIFSWNRQHAIAAISENDEVIHERAF